ncbi:YigZ family protein [Chloroflexales bacterium ZM16-3]|nr:YigZ family protein [Chloroflexales bacterium ZM16-3]
MSSDSRYPIPAARARAEIVVINSRFIADAAPTADIAAAKAFIAETRAAMPDARHHCFAYLVGYGASVTAGMSDDGEPAGTAGRPMLAVLRGADLGDVAVVVTRYFGGTLLGTGGLVRAYGDAVKAVLEALPRGERVALRSLLVQTSYSDYAAIRRALEAHGATIEEEDFAADVSIVASLPADGYERCLADLAEISAGRVMIDPL